MMDTCDCILRVNRALEDSNGMLDIGDWCSFETGERDPARASVSVRKLDSKSRQRPPQFMQSNYCPFCGVKYLGTPWVAKEATP